MRKKIFSMIASAQLLAGYDSVLFFQSVIVYACCWLEGELFYASGEVAVKPSQAPSPSAQQTPQLGLFRTGPGQTGESSAVHGDFPQTYGELDHFQQPQARDANCSAKGQGESGEGEVNDVKHIERLLEQATATLSTMEVRMAELARDRAQARFDLEDAQVRHAAAQAQVKKYSGCKRALGSSKRLA